MVDWKAKLTSRKLWMALIGLISGILLAFKVDAETVETISGMVMSMASVVAYILGEGLIDAASAGQDMYITDPVATEELKPPEEDGAA